MRLVIFYTFDINYVDFLKSVQLYDSYVSNMLVIKDTLACEIRKELEEKDYIIFLSLVLNDEIKSCNYNTVFW